MKIFPFGPDRGVHVDRFGSDFVLSRLAHPAGLHVGCMHFPAGGSVGSHEAATYQLFIVVQGDGWVQSADGERLPLGSGEAAFWEPGERHAAGTDGGMTAIVVEGDVLGDDVGAIGPVR